MPWNFNCANISKASCQDKDWHPMLAGTQKFHFNFSWKPRLSHLSGRVVSDRRDTAEAAIFVCLKMSPAFPLWSTDSLDLQLCHKKRWNCGIIARTFWWHFLKPKDTWRLEKAREKEQRRLDLTKAGGISLHMSVQRLWMPNRNAVLAMRSSAAEGTMFLHGEDSQVPNKQPRAGR